LFPFLGDDPFEATLWLFSIAKTTILNRKIQVKHPFSIAKTHGTSTHQAGCTADVGYRDEHNYCRFHVGKATGH
jgi:hypothetical protein